MEHLIEISQERFFKDVEELDDIGYWQLNASEHREESDKDGAGDFVLGIEEVKSWPNCRFFAALPKVEGGCIDSLYVIRPLDGEPIQGAAGETKWYHFGGGSWSCDPEPGEQFIYPSQVSCNLYGDHLRVRYVNINEGSGFEAEYPFEDLVKIFSHLRDIYRALDKSNVKMMTFDLKVKTSYPGDEEFRDLNNHTVNVSDGTVVLYKGRVLTVFSADEPVEHGGGEPDSSRRVFKFFDQDTKEEVDVYTGDTVRCQKLVDTGHRR